MTSKYDNVLKKIDVNFSSVDIVVHQDALMDIVDKINKFTDEVLNNTKNLLILQESEPISPKPDSPEPRKFQRKNSVKKFIPSKVSLKTAVIASNWASKAKMKQSMKNPVDLKVFAKLQMVNFVLMTSKINLAKMRVQDLRATYVAKKDLKEATAKLVDFEILDTSKNHTLYR